MARLNRPGIRGGLRRLSEHAAAGLFVHGDGVRSALKGVGQARSVLREERQDAGATGLGLRAGHEKELGKPVFGVVHGLEVMIVR